MDHQKKLDFVLKMTKQALESIPVQHFDFGGEVKGQSSTPDTNSGGDWGYNKGVDRSDQSATGAPVTFGGMVSGLQQGVGAQSRENPTQGSTGPNTATTSPTVANDDAHSKVADPTKSIPTLVTNPTQSVHDTTQYVGGMFQDVGSAFTAQNHYQANLAPTTMYDYGNTMNSAQANIGQGYNQSQIELQNQSNLESQQQALAQQYGALARGEGYNPAQAMLNQRTGQNISQQAALAASTRGAGANAGLIAANNARQGAATQQEAVGQGATLQAQQSNQALQNQGNQYNAISAHQTAIQNAIQGQQGIQGNLYGASINANNAQNNTNVANYGMAQGINSQVAQKNADATNATTAGLLNGAGSAAAMFLAEGGEVKDDSYHQMAQIYYPHMYEGGSMPNFGVGDPGSVMVSTPKFEPTVQQKYGLEGMMGGKGGKGGGGMGGMMGGGEGGSAAGAGEGAGAAALAGGMAQGGQVQEKLKKGGKVPGKPKVNHNDYDNDTVPALLSPGEVVIDLNTLHDKGKLGQMARFVAANIERKKAGRRL